MAPFIASLLLRDNPVSLLDSPYLSPAADSVPATPELFARFPPCLVTGGKMEHYIEDVRELVKRLKLGAVECEYLEGKGAPHDWLILDWVSDKRKAGAVEQMQAWVDKQFA
jgi:acetyl esterase/lipase